LNLFTSAKAGSPRRFSEKWTGPRSAQFGF
jgi:hypothetical protein